MYVKAIRSFIPAGGNMNTLDLIEAASFLKMNPRSLAPQSQGGTGARNESGEMLDFC
jgi:hypothetical protein